MKLSKREKVLICILLIALVVYAAYKFVPTSELFNLEAIRTEYNQMTDKYNNMSQNILLKSNYEENVQTLVEEINNMNVISNLQQEQLIVFLNNYFSANNIDANNISFTDAAIVTMDATAASSEAKAQSSLDILMNNINGTTSQAQQLAENTNASQHNGIESTDNSAQQSSVTVRSISINAVFESTYSNMIKFIDAMQNNTVDISIININTVSSEGGLLQGTMTLNFYEIPKPEGFEENKDEWIWKDLAKSGKSNPFSGDESTVFASTGNSYDFYISVKPESSDLPTLIVGKSEDNNRTTYVYADNNKIEDVEFQFKTENNTYYYRYSAKNSTYPLNGWQEFEPVKNGDIYIKVYSSLRNTKADSAGVNISVLNTSGLKIRFEVEGDDTTSPRVYFKEPKSVIVTRR